MDHLPLLSHPEGKVETLMQFAPGTFTSRLAAGPVHGDEAAAQKGLLVEDLG
jgi:hypothetical protein